jgi:hypothetical protein
MPTRSVVSACVLYYVSLQDSITRHSESGRQAAAEGLCTDVELSFGPWVHRRLGWHLFRDASWTFGHFKARPEVMPSEKLC